MKKILFILSFISTCYANKIEGLVSANDLFAEITKNSSHTSNKELNDFIKETINFNYEATEKPITALEEAPYNIYKCTGLSFCIEPEVIHYLVRKSKGFERCRFLELGADKGALSLIMGAVTSEVYVNEINPLQIQRMQRLMGRLKLVDNAYAKKFHLLPGNLFDVLEESAGQNKTYDIIVMNNVFHFFPYTQSLSFFNLIKKVMHPNSLFYMNVNGPYPLLREFPDKTYVNCFNLLFKISGKIVETTGLLSDIHEDDLEEAVNASATPMDLLTVHANGLEFRIEFCNFNKNYEHLPSPIKSSIKSLVCDEEPEFVLRNSLRSYSYTLTCVKNFVRFFSEEQLKQICEVNSLKVIQTLATDKKGHVINKNSFKASKNQQKTGILLSLLDDRQVNLS